MLMLFYCRPKTGGHAICHIGYLVISILLMSLPGMLYGANNKGLTLTLPEVLARVLRDSPELATYPYDIRAAEAQALQAGLRPNPRVSVEVENVAGSGELSRADSMEATLALSQVIEMGGKRALRQNVGRLRRQSLERDYELARLDALSAAASRYLEVAQTQRLLAFARQVVELTDSAEQVAQDRFDAGSASRAELSRARTDLMQARLETSNLEVLLDNAKRRLSSQWGEVEPDFSTVEAELFALTPVPDFASLRAQLERTPQLQRFLTLERLRQAELDLAIARGHQNIEMGAGIRHIAGSNETGLVFEFSMPLAIFNRNQGNTRAAREALAKLDLEEQATRTKVFTELRTAFARLEQAREQVRVLREQILPEAQQALELVQEGYGDGLYSYLELAEARRQLLTFETEAVTAATDFHQTLIILEALTGQALTGERQFLYDTETIQQFQFRTRLPETNSASNEGVISPQDQSP